MERSKSRFTREEIVSYVTEIIDGKISIRGQAAKAGISEEAMRQWIRNYQAIGADAFCQNHWSRRSRTEKEQAVADYLNGCGSLNDNCKKYRIKSHSVLQRWIAKYNGHEELKGTSSAGGKIMTKGRKTTFDERITIVEECIAEGIDYNEIAVKYGVSYQQVYTWVKKFQKDGVESLKDRRGKHKEEDSMTEVEKLRAENKLLKAEKQRQQMEIDFLKKLEEIERRRY